MNFIHDDQSQEFYDAFNKFIFSPDKKVFNKLLSKHTFIQKIKSIPGDIVELGVFKGSGILTWLKCLQYENQNRKVIGFDFFDYKANLETLNGNQKEMMKNLFEQRNFTDQVSYIEYLTELCNGAGLYNHEFIKGDVTETVEKYLKDNPGFRTSIVNFDLDVDEPTYHCMKLLWDRLMPGGIFIFDEYGIPEWTESDGVDRFLKERSVEMIKLQTTNIFAPSAFIVK